MSNYWLFSIWLMLIIVGIGMTQRDEIRTQELREIKAELIKMNKQKDEAIERQVDMIIEKLYQTPAK